MENALMQQPSHILFQDELMGRWSHTEDSEGGQFTSLVPGVVTSKLDTLKYLLKN